MNVVLYQVGRNLNRAYRTAEAFGIKELLLLECKGSIQGNLFSATDRILVRNIEEWPKAKGLLVLENWYKMPLRLVDWSLVETVLIGGESTRLSWSVESEQKAVIPMHGKIGCLTTEAALAIALYEWRLNANL